MANVRVTRDADPTTDLPFTNHYADQPLDSSSAATAPAAPQQQAPAGDLPFTNHYENQPSEAMDPYKDESWREWGMRKANENWQKASTARASDWGRASLEDISLGAAAPIQSYFTGEPVADIRARDAASQEALGPIASGTLSAATYALGPGKILGPLAGAAKLGKLAAAGIEGASAGGLTGALHGEKSDQIVNDSLWGSMFGMGGQAAAKITAPLVKAGANKVRGLPGSKNDPNLSDWRERVAAGEDIGPSVDPYRQLTAAGTPERKALDKIYDASQASTDPGVKARLAAELAARGGSAINGMTGGWGDVLAGRPISSSMRDLMLSGAQKVNQANKASNFNQTVDNVYPSLFGRPISTDTSGWMGAKTGFTPRWEELARGLSIGDSLQPQSAR